MPDITFNDNLTAGADASLNDSAKTAVDDGSLLAKLGLKKLVAKGKAFVAQLSGPVNNAPFAELDLDATLTSPELLSGDASSLKIGGNTAAKMVIKPGGELLDDIGASADSGLPEGATWVGFTLCAGVDIDANASAGSAGLEVEGNTDVAVTAYTPVEANTPLRDAWTAALRNFGVASGAAALRSMPTGVVYETEAQGSITTTVSFKQGFDINALVSTSLPVVKKNFSVQPSVSVGVKGSVELAGDFLVRAYKPDAATLVLGVYTKRGVTLQAKLTAKAGLEGNIGDTDVAAAVLQKALGVDVTKANLPGDAGKALNDVVQDSLDQSLAVQIAATASTAREVAAAVLFRVALSDATKAATDAALTSAVRGDWTALDKLGNATRLNDSVTRTQKNKLALSFNFLGLYNATSVETYLQSCTIQHDKVKNQVTVGDKVQATKTDAEVLTVGADPKKLRKALMLDFLCTMTYVAANGKTGADMAVTHTYLDYGASMSHEDMLRNVQLAYTLGAPAGSLDEMLAGQNKFPNACARIRAEYTNEQALGFFFSDAMNYTPRDPKEIERLGRDTLARTIVNDGDAQRKRIAFLQNGAAWDAARGEGEGYLRNHAVDLHLDSTMLLFFLADYRAVTWWANAVANVGPALAKALKALQGVAGDPSQNKDFMDKRADVADKLGKVAGDLDGSLEPTWGEAVMYGLAGKQGKVSIDLACTGLQRHFPAPQ